MAIPTPVLAINKSYLNFDEISCPDFDFPCINVLPYALATLFYIIRVGPDNNPTVSGDAKREVTTRYVPKSL